MLKILHHHWHISYNMFVYVLQKVRCKMFKMWGPSATTRRSDESSVTCVPPTVLCLCGMLSAISERGRVHASRWTTLLQTGIWEGVIYDATGQPIRYNLNNIFILLVIFLNFCTLKYFCYSISVFNEMLTKFGHFKTQFNCDGLILVHMKYLLWK
jgi:hypothetical protein